MLKHFTLTKSKFILSAVEDIVLSSYVWSVFRDAFENTFKKTICIQNPKNECVTCVFQKECVYPSVFETPIPDDERVLKQYKSVPHPFIIGPILNVDKIIKRGDEIEFYLVIISKAIEYLPCFIYTFNELGKRGIGKNRGRFILKEVQSIDVNGQAQLIYKSGDKALKSGYTIIKADQLNHVKNKNEMITLEFLTPYRDCFESK